MIRARRIVVGEVAAAEDLPDEVDLHGRAASIGLLYLAFGVASSTMVTL